MNEVMNERQFRHQVIELACRTATEIAAILEKMWRGTDRESDLALAEEDLVDYLLVAVQEWCNGLHLEREGKTVHYSDNYFDLAS